jgi:hypothetical protein
MVEFYRVFTFVGAEGELHGTSNYGDVFAGVRTYRAPPFDRLRP